MEKSLERVEQLRKIGSSFFTDSNEHSSLQRADHRILVQFQFYMYKYSNLCRQLKPEGWELFNAFVFLQLNYIHEMFINAFDHPAMIKALQTAFLSSPKSDFAAIIASPTSTIRKGSFYHLGPLAAWVADLCNFYNQQFYMHFNKSGNEAQSSPLSYLFHAKSRRLLLEVLYIVKIYLVNLASLVLAPPSAVTPAVHALLKQLIANMETNRPRIDQFAAFLTSLPRITGDAMMKSMFVRAALPPSNVLDSVKQPFEARLPAMYPWNSTKQVPFTESDPMQLANQLASFSMFANTSNLTLVDQLSKTKVSNNATQCSNCCSFRNPVSQKDPEYMAFISAFKSEAPWRNAFESSCICGGRWDAR